MGAFVAHKICVGDTMNSDFAAISGSALRAQNLRFSVSAEKISQMAYAKVEPKRVVVESRVTGGVNAWVQSVPLPFLHGRSHLSLANEMVKQRGAQRAYQAQIRVLKNEEALSQSVLDIRA